MNNPPSRPADVVALPDVDPWFLRHLAAQHALPLGKMSSLLARLMTDPQMREGIRTAEEAWLTAKLAWLEQLLKGEPPPRSPPTVDGGAA